MQFRHVGIVVDNIEKVLPFYQGLGMKVAYDQVERVRIVKLDGGIELLEYESMDGSVLRQKGISHVAFMEDPEGNNIEMVYKDKNYRRKEIKHGWKMTFPRRK